MTVLVATKISAPLCSPKNQYSFFRPLDSPTAVRLFSLAAVEPVFPLHFKSTRLQR